MAQAFPHEQASLPVIVVPVRIALGTQALQSTTRALTAESAFLRTTARPLPGLRVGLRLYLPSGAPEEVSSIVVNRKAPEGETGFWVDFVALSAGAKARLDSLVASKRIVAAAFAGAGNPAGAAAGKPAGAAAGNPLVAMVDKPAAPSPVLLTSPLSRPRVSVPPPVLNPVAPPPPAPARPEASDLRSTQRVAANLRVRFQTAAALKEEISTNISAGGMFIRTDTPPQLREMVKVSIELPGESEPIEAQAQVVHRVTREEGRLTGRVAGVGVQFFEADDRFREALDAWLARTQT
jgi:type IV pilus assembly protein PilZ